MQIAEIKQRLKLTAAQEKYWPPMETALREAMVQFYDYQKRSKKSGDETFDTNSAAVTRLKDTSRALFAQLRNDQKNEIMMLARICRRLIRCCRSDRWKSHRQERRVTLASTRLTPSQ